MRRRGGAAIETALIFPLLLAMMACIFDVAWFLHRRNMVSEAASVGARAAGLTEDPADVQTVAEAAVNARLGALGFDAAGATVTASVIEGTVDTVEVEVVVDHTPFTGLVPVPSSIDVRSSSQFENVGG